MSVKVVARIRPLSKSELEEDSILSTSSPSDEYNAQPTIVRIPNPKNEGEQFSFQFNSVYGSQTTQKELFEQEGTHSSC